MWKFISNILTMVSMGILLYLVARTLPKIDDTESGEKTLAKSHWIFYYMEKIDTRLKSYSEKSLRKTGIVLLKLENKVQKKLSRFKKANSGSDLVSLNEDLNSSDKDL